MSRDPYHVIIVRPTGSRRADITISERWVNGLGLFCIVATIVFVAMVYMLVQDQRKIEVQADESRVQTEEINHLNIALAQKDEEIIRLKKVVSSTVRHSVQAPPVEITLPDLKPPIVEISEMKMDGNQLTFRIVNINPGTGKTADGHFFAVFRKGKGLFCVPQTLLRDGVPEKKDAGLEFSLYNYKPMRITPPVPGWERATFFVFDAKGAMRLVMTVKREDM
ncbi:MAG: hypothetical protein U9P80_02030 [Thermodesulfobacteriota bacterium]|nr:hypothetical protein [Thermodesulfobacteriota bacterium]